MHRERVEQFVGKMDPAQRPDLERRDALAPADFVARPGAQRGLLLLLEAGIGLDDPVFQPGEQIGRKFLQPRDDILRELPVVSPFLDDGEGDG